MLESKVNEKKEREKKQDYVVYSHICHSSVAVFEERRNCKYPTPYF